MVSSRTYLLALVCSFHLLLEVVLNDGTACVRPASHRNNFLPRQPLHPLGSHYGRLVSVTQAPVVSPAPREQKALLAFLGDHEVVVLPSSSLNDRVTFQILHLSRSAGLALGLKLKQIDDCQWVAIQKVLAGSFPEKKYSHHPAFFPAGRTYWSPKSTKRLLL